MLSSAKHILIWRRLDDGKIALAYNIGTEQVVKTLRGSYTDVRPAAAGFQGLLYVFARGLDLSVHVYVIDGSGALVSKYSLGSKGLYTNGAFEATVFNGRLYLVFAGRRSDRVNVAYCAAGADCKAGLFAELSPGRFSKELNMSWRAHPGLSAIAASRVNGAMSSEHLWIAFSAQQDDRIRVVSVHRDHSIGVLRLMPLSPFHPEDAATTTLPLELTVRESVFPFVAGVPSPPSYLYLTWVGRGSKTIYTSVLQDWGFAYTGNPLWYTRPVDSAARAAQQTGVSWRLDPGMATSDDLVFLYVEVTFLWPVVLRHNSDRAEITQHLEAAAHPQPIRVPKPVTA